MSECQEGASPLSASERHGLLKQVGTIYTSIRRNFLTTPNQQSDTNHRAKVRERRSNVSSRCTPLHTLGGQTQRGVRERLNSPCVCCRNIIVDTASPRRHHPMA